AYISASPERVAASRLFWRGELASARTALGSLLALADTRGDPTSYAMIRMHVVELELRAGELEAAARWADETIKLAQASGTMWDELEARRARGIKGLIEGAPDQALADLWAVWEHCEREGVLEPGVFPVAPELVEAQVELARFEDADAVTGRLRELASSGYTEAGGALLEEAAVELQRLGLQFDGARCLLALGRAGRRHKR